MKSVPDDQTDRANQQSGASSIVRSGSDGQGTSAVAHTPSPATNLLIADIVLRGASDLLRKNVERKVGQAAPNRADQSALDGRTILTTLTLYGASKLATRSVTGLAIVAGGLVINSLYDRGKLREQRGETGEHGPQES